MTAVASDPGIDMSEASDRQFMQRALDLAAHGRFTTRPNPMVGCVLVQGDAVVGEGWHRRAGGPHAEVHALRQAGDKARGATAYVTLEPCAHHGRTPPCADALIGAGVARVVAAMVDPDPRVAGQGLQRLREAGMDVSSGVLEAEARELNSGFLSRIERGRPWVRMKIAMSLDGKVALADGSSQWITGSAAREHGHQWRARAGVILTGVGTVIADDPQLTVRLDQDRAATIPLVVDSQGRCPREARLFSLHPEVWLAGPAVAFAAQYPANARQLDVAKQTSGGVDLVALLKMLADEHINEVHVEAGPRLNAALLSADVVDELLIFQAGKFLGNQALSGVPVDSPQQIPGSDWESVEVQLMAGDCFSRWRRRARG